jgi:hypothetical protein
VPEGLQQPLVSHAQFLPRLPWWLLLLEAACCQGLGGRLVKNELLVWDLFNCKDDGCIGFCKGICGTKSKVCLCLCSRLP